MEFEQDINVADMTYSANPVQVVYDAIRFVLQVLYDSASPLINEIIASILGQETTLWIDLPSGLAFPLAIKTNGTWAVPNFVPPAQVIEGFTLHIPGFQFNWDVYWNIAIFWDFIMPKLSNWKISETDFNWIDRNTNEHYLGSERGRYLMASDASLDAMILAFIVAIGIALVHLGQPHISEIFTNRAFSLSTLNQSASAYKNAQQLISIVSKSNSIIASTENIDENVESVATGQTGLNNKLGDLEEGLTIASQIATILSKTSDLLLLVNALPTPDNEPILAKIAELKALIGLRMRLSV